MELIFASGEEIGKSNAGLAILADMTEAYGIVAEPEFLKSDQLIYKIHEHMVSNDQLYTEQFLGFVAAVRLSVDEQRLNHLIYIPLSIITEEGIFDADSEKPISLQVFNNNNQPVIVESDGQVPLGQLSDTAPGLIESLKLVWVGTTKRILNDLPAFSFDEKHNMVISNHLVHSVFAEITLTELGLNYQQINAEWANKIVRIRNEDEARVFAELCTGIYQTKLSDVAPEVTDPTHRQYLALVETVKAV